MVARFTIKVDCCVTLYVLLLFFITAIGSPMTTKSSISVITILPFSDFRSF